MFWLVKAQDDNKSWSLSSNDYSLTINANWAKKLKLKTIFKNKVQQLVRLAEITIVMRGQLVYAGYTMYVFSIYSRSQEYMYHAQRLNGTQKAPVLYWFIHIINVSWHLHWLLNYHICFYRREFFCQFMKMCIYYKN